jgi:hypothetical protein
MSALIAVCFLIQEQRLFTLFFCFYFIIIISSSSSRLENKYNSPLLLICCSLFCTFMIRVLLYVKGRI